MYMYLPVNVDYKGTPPPPTHTHIRSGEQEYSVPCKELLSTILDIIVTLVSPSNTRQQNMVLSESSLFDQYLSHLIGLSLHTCVCVCVCVRVHVVNNVEQREN